MERRQEARLGVKCSQGGPDPIAPYIFNGIGGCCMPLTLE
jgi:hypothetical protein